MVLFQRYIAEEKLDKTLTLLKKDVNPIHTKRIYTNTKATLEGFKSAKGQPAAIADEVIAKLIMVKTYPGMNEDGTEYTVKNMKIEDIQYYYDNL
jgi:zinc protease